MTSASGQRVRVIQSTEDLEEFLALSRAASAAKEHSQSCDAHKRETSALTLEVPSSSQTAGVVAENDSVNECDSVSGQSPAYEDENASAIERLDVAGINVRAVEPLDVGAIEMHGNAWGDVAVAEFTSRAAEERKLLAAAERPPAPKQKPNAICLCGSGKKFKKCCGYAYTTAPVNKMARNKCTVVGGIPGSKDLLLVRFAGTEEPVAVPLSQACKNPAHAQASIQGRGDKTASEMLAEKLGIPL